MKSIVSLTKAVLATGAMACALVSPAQSMEMPLMPSSHDKPEAVPLSQPMPIFLRGLALNEVQRDEVFAILHEQAPKIRQKTKSIHATQEALRNLAFSNRFDDAKARSLTDAAAKDMAEMSLLRARADQMIYALLTAEQRQQLNAIQENRHEGMPAHGKPPVKREH